VRGATAERGAAVEGDGGGTGMAGPVADYRQPPEQRQKQQSDPPQPQQEDPVGHHTRTDTPAAHLSHSTLTFVAEGGSGGASNLDEPTRPEEPRQTGAMGPTDTKHRSDDTSTSSNGRHDDSTTRPKCPRW